jgi:hypothetical protein
MAIEGLDASPLIENGGFVPQANIAVSPAEDGEPTLDAALAEAGRAARLAREAPDLWISEGHRPADMAGPGPDAPRTVALTVPAPLDAEAAADHPLVKERLTFAELGHVLANRQFDSTDYWWDETSTGDYEWAQRNFQDDVYAGVQEATQGAGSPEEAAAMAQAYLNAIGLGGLVHVGGSTGGSNDEIVITAPTNTYHPTTFMPDLSLDRNVFDGFDPRPVYDTLDVSSHTIAIETDEPLTPAQLEAVEKLRLQIARTTAMLNSLPITGIFTFPDGTSVTVADLRTLWARTDIVVTSRNYSELGIPGIPGMGAAIWNNGDSIFEVNINALTNQFMPMPWSQTWWPLHELAHVTALGRSLTATMWADGIQTVDEYRWNESFATSMAIAIAAAGGYQWSPFYLNDPDIQAQLQRVPLPTFVPIGGGGSGGGGGGDGGGDGGYEGYL